MGKFPRSPQSKQFPPRDGVIFFFFIRSFEICFSFFSFLPLLHHPFYFSFPVLFLSYPLRPVSFSSPPLHFFPFLPSSLQLIPFFFEAFSPHPLPLSLPSIARWRPGPLPCTSRLSHERCQHHLASASNITLFLTKERKNIRIQRNHPCL